jgi:hypothetical protein
MQLNITFNVSTLYTLPIAIAGTSAMEPVPGQMFNEARLIQQARI